MKLYTAPAGGAIPAGIPTLALDPRSYPDRRAFDLDLFARVAASGAELRVLAGFMRIIDAAALASLKQLEASSIDIELPTIADSLAAVRNFKVPRAKGAR